MVKSNQVWSGVLVSLDATGALATPSVGPAGVLYVDGAANGAAVTISGTNPYKWTVTLPTLTAGQTVSMYITATIVAIATASVVAEDIADTKLVSDLNDAAAAPSASANAAATAAAILVTPANKLATAATGEASANVTLWAGGAVAGAPALEATTQAILEDTGTTLPGLIAGVGAGSGTGVYTDTLESPTGVPVDGARVTLATDEDGENVAYEARTDAFGVFEMRPDPGTYYRFIEAAGHTFTQGVAVEVTEP